MAKRRWNDNPTKGTKWKKDLIYNLLHHVGDDPVKSQIENDLADTFKDQPEVLDKIAKIFVRACPTD